MGLQPKLDNKPSFTLKQCARCHQSFGPEGFAPTKSLFYSDGYLPICNDCIDKIIGGAQGNWEKVNKLCQLGDIPFVPKEWENIYQMNPIGAFGRYATIFLQSEFDGLDWGNYFEAYCALRDAGNLEHELPLLGDEKLRQLRERWGSNYDEDALNYLEDLFNGLLATQNVNGALQTDQALKICKMSYEIDCRIREGADFDKVLSAYDKMVKAAEFTPKNVKNINDFDSIGELIRWLEKKGWRNQYYDNVSKDIVDETIKNMQSFAQRLYTNESGIGDDITRRIEMLQSVGRIENQDSEGYYLDNSDHDLDNYENDGYLKLFGNEEFDPSGGE